MSRFTPSVIAQRSTEQAIGFLMQQGIENADCLSLAAGFVDLESLPVELVLEAATDIFGAANSQHVLQYGTTQGVPAVRDTLRTYLADLENCKPEAIPLDQIMLTTGSQQLLSLLAQAIFDPGDICLVAAPTYFVFLGVLDSVGANVIAIDTDNDGMCPDGLDRVLGELAESGQLERVKMVYVVSYHDNPAGITVSEERRPRLLEAVRRWSTKNTIYLLEDAAYRELCYDEVMLPSIWSYDDGFRSPDSIPQQVILSQTFSKSFSPGVRVGLGVLPRELIKPVSDLKGNEDFGSANVNQHLIARVHESGRYQTHLNSLRERYRKKRDVAVSAAEEYFSDLTGVSWHSPNGGLYVWMSLPEQIATGFDSPLFQRATQAHKVMYVPGELCYPSEDENRPCHEMRLSFGVLQPDDLREGMRRLSVAVSEQMQEQGLA
ncbi:MAG TPA: PLP-dependent aminotransferase family protein [Planctomycetaceae bacterium]|nr:PLP-dependent aminotransferase family protein [Planctomycetaceae bacterium]